MQQNQTRHATNMHARRIVRYKNHNINKAQKRTVQRQRNAHRHKWSRYEGRWDSIQFLARLIHLSEKAGGRGGRKGSGWRGGGILFEDDGGR